MSIDIIVACISAVSSLSAAVAVAVIGVGSKKNEKRAEEEKARIERQAKERKTESLLSMRLMYSTTVLSSVTVKALRDGHTNGETAAALSEVEEAQRAYKEFIENTALSHINE